MRAVTRIAPRRSRHETLGKLLASPRLNVEKIAYLVTENPPLLPALLDAIESPLANVRFGAMKALCLVSERAPQLVYRLFDRLLPLLDSENAILRWEATRILANLASVDHQERIEGILVHYMSPIGGGEMIGAATCIRGAARIAQAKPHLADCLAEDVLKVESANYKTPECRNVAIGHAIVAFEEFFRELHYARYAVLEFVMRQLKNPRSATQKKAEAFLKKHAT